MAVSSISVTHYESGRLAYASSKAALECGVKILAKEALRYNTRVNAVRAAMTDTAMAEDYLSLTGKEESDVLSIQPLGMIETSDIVKLMLYLLSDGSNKITGSVFEITAGMI